MTQPPKPNAVSKPCWYEQRTRGEGQHSKLKKYVHRHSGLSHAAYDLGLRLEISVSALLAGQTRGSPLYVFVIVRMIDGVQLFESTAVVQAAASTAGESRGAVSQRAERTLSMESTASASVPTAAIPKGNQSACPCATPTPFAPLLGCQAPSSNNP